jgi:hypothetical protein
MISKLGLSALCLIALFTASGCSKAKLDPCGLLGVSEAQLFDNTISSSKAFPPEGAEKNDLCLYYNANGEPRLMLFVWSDRNIDPIAATKSGMSGSESKVIEITGVGEKAAAGFSSGELKLFAAKNNKGMIGVRVRDSITQNDARFDDVKALVAKLLGRLK